MDMPKGALTEEFRKRRGGLLPGTACTTLAQDTHPLSGARLVVARIERKPYPVQGRFVTGWIPADSETIWFYKNFETENKARKAFKDAQQDGPPLHRDFRQDPQVNDVYAWQDHFQYYSPQLTQPEMEKVCGKLAAIFNMEAPRVIYKPQPKKTVHAEAILDRNEIRMYRPYLSMLVHEMAHLINDQVNRDKWSWHGPGFMRTYLSVLSLFAQISGKMDIEARARAQAIEIADSKEVSSCAVLAHWLRRTHHTDDPRTIPSLI